jgi:hypothetical protein
MAIAIALVTRWTTEDQGLWQFSAVVINLSATFLILRFCTVIHESGHLLAARLTGGVPKRMILGMGHEIGRAEIGGIKIVMNSIPSGGRAMAIFGSTQTKWKIAFFAAGGIIANVIIAFVFYLLFGFRPNYLTGEFGIDLATPVIAGNLLGLINLIPFYTSAHGAKLPTDGLRLLQLPFKPIEYEHELEEGVRLFDAYEYFEKGEYDKALLIYNEAFQRNPKHLLLVLNICLCYLRLGDMERVAHFLPFLEEQVNSDQGKQIKGVLHNNIAWVFLVMGDLTKAYHHSSLAVRAAPRNVQLNGTYGSILVERGEAAAGINWLVPLIDLNTPNNDTVTASVYLMLACHLMGDIKDSNEHRQFVEKNISFLSADGLILWHRCLNKVNGNT